MRATLSNGMVIEGTPDQIASTARALGLNNPLEGDGIHYLSDSRGIVRISEMTTQHIRNAILKRYRGWVADLSTTTDTRRILEMLRSGPRDITILALIKELHTRV